MKIRQRVTQLLKELQIKEPAVNVEEVVKALGIELIREPFEGDLSGALLRGTKKTLIGVNSKHPEQRQRFTIAHECGHFILHKSSESHYDRRVLMRNTKSSLASDPMEIEANRFAAELLMPKTFILEDLNRYNITDFDDEALHQLATRYEVSLQAITIRLTSLGLLTI